MIRPSLETDLSKQLRDLHGEELDIKEALEKEPHVENGRLDYSNYEELMNDLRKNHEKVAVIVLQRKP